MRVVALGFWSDEDRIEHITNEQSLQLTSQDVVIVDGQGDRLMWTYRGTKRRVADILPTASQKDELCDFLEQGGTIITFPADPFAQPTVPLFPEELPKGRRWWNYKVIVTGGLAEIEIPAFDWLPDHTWSLLQEVYTIFAREKVAPTIYCKEVNQLEVTMMSTIQAMTIRVGCGRIMVCREQSFVNQVLASLETTSITSLEEMVA
ncbi:hypothetical protein [Dictyobacter formicarum]|uniref:Uncharacterized protein n=1 Tax=Dictyobacter formicarum TaxID=2778368 RepID=A0ABQ3VU81_9CHLR|nr:hypothetical protein [Dictyobacter formicarum]GHO89525.1 hypothetical protein KSZ_75310 [Dictyobacter formicarum]